MKAVFDADGKKWMGPYKTPAGAVFVRLNTIDVPSEEVWLAAKPEVEKALLQRKKQQMEQSFVKSLADKSEIVIKNNEILDNL